MKGKRDYILTVAERLFAERGYNGVGIRDIAKGAKCNISTIYHYFGSKKGLYLAVFRERVGGRARRIHESFWQMLRGSRRPAPEDIIKALAKAFLQSPFPEEERLLHQRLMAREVSRPTEAFAIIDREVFAPFLKAITDLLVPGGDEEERLLYGISILSQVLYYNFARAAVSHTTGREYTPEFLERLIGHIVRFSLRGLAGRKGCGQSS